MTPNSKTRLPIYAAAWLATAVATFCLGRMTSGTLRETVFGGTKGDQNSGTGYAASGTSGSASASKAGASEDILARTFGGHATALNQILGGKTLEEHLKALLKVDDEAVRMLGFLRLLEALNTPEDIKAALELIGKENGGRFRITETSMLLQKWTQMDPKAAAAFASSQRDFSRFTGMNAVLRTWLKSNPDDAIAWAQANGVQNQEGDQQANNRGPGRGGPDDGNWAMATLMGPLAQQNLNRALELAKDQPESRARGRMIDTLVEEMVAQRGLDEARNVLADLPDDAFRAGMAGQIVTKMLQKSEAKDVLTQAWAFPSGQTRKQAMGQVIGQVADDNPVEAAKMITNLPESPDLDSAKGSLAREIARKDPDGAIAWAQAISNEQDRMQTLQRVIGGLARENPALAQQYATQYGIQFQTQRGPDGGGFGGGRIRGGGGGGGR
jgi:hypothetical protein